MFSLIEIHRDEFGHIARVEVDLWSIAFAILWVAFGLRWIFG